jgi:superfamily II DNA or RNA helicase
MRVVHANWSDGALCLWGEDADRARASMAAVPGTHPFASSVKDLGAALGAVAPHGTVPGTLTVLLPHGQMHHARCTLPSVRLSALLGVIPPDEDALTLEPVEVPCLRVPAIEAIPFLLRVIDAAEAPGAAFATGHMMRWWRALARFAVDLIADQRVVPSVTQHRSGAYSGAWRAWLSDPETDARLTSLLASMPAAARAVDGGDGRAWPVVDAFLAATVDATVRASVVEESYADALEDRDPLADPHTAWLTGLLRATNAVELPTRHEYSLLRGARSWLSLLDESRQSRGFRLRLEVREPELDAGDDGVSAHWTVSFSLADPEDQSHVVDAESIFARRGGRRRNGSHGAHDEELAEMLLKELGRASRIWTDLEDALEDEAPTGIELDTARAYRFMRDVRPVLLEAGIEVAVPSWWGDPASRIGARLIVESPDGPMPGGSGEMAPGTVTAGVGLQALVDYRWQLAIGDQAVPVELLEKLAARGAPLVRVAGQWIDLRPEDLETAVQFLKEHPGGAMSLLEALRMAHGLDGPPDALPILGLEATGWVRDLLQSTDSDQVKLIDAPKAFRGTLRPYQRVGVSWLAFLDRHRLGACLADDMGLGKTIQLIALLQHERERGDMPGPTLLVAPMSVLGNWKRELERFAPELTVHVQHGLERPAGERLVRAATESDIVLTTYAITVRDRESLSQIPWRRVVLDEAQHIKNPPTKQTTAIRSLKAEHRVALTGTPVENRLAELWSIMEFCCPGYLGTGADFRRRFAVPVERNRDKVTADRLRALVRPFVLRRLKVDPNVISDLPPLVESRQHVPLSAEQAKLYDVVVKDMLAKVDSAEGIRRRGLVLSALVKLKQICNHPAHFLREGAGASAIAVTAPKSRGPKSELAAASANAAAALADDAAGKSDPSVDDAIDDAPLPPEALATARSGKTQRLMEMLEEALAAGDRALIFTQYRQMGHLLVSMIRADLDVDALFLHGGTPQARRDALVDRFQSGDPSSPIFVLSLKAGGVGLNLTAANHVFHFDRWWNPAVENQATDRAFRIGQTRTVNVHKFVCSGTLEERIDQMIEQKTELASQVIGSDDAWLTELSTNQLRDLLLLRRGAMEGDE